MIGEDSNLKNPSEQFLKSLNKSQIGAAASKLFAAGIGDMAVLLSRSHAHKHYSLADIEWMVMPPLMTGQLYIVEAADQERGFRAPIAAVTWAFVPEDTDARLRQSVGRRIRLRPDEWKSGEIGWLIDALGNGKGMDAALQWLKAGPFKEKPLNLMARDKQGALTVSTLDAVMADRTESTAA